jgi:hypothetical protein
VEEKPIPPKTRDLQDHYWPVGDVVGGLAFMALSVFAIVGALNMPRRGTLGFVTAAGFTPTLIGSLLFVLSATLVALTLRTHGYRSIAGWARSTLSNDIVRRWLTLVALIGVYVALVGWIHFIVLQFLFFVAIFAYLRVGRAWHVLVYSVLGAALIGYLIPEIFEMPIP